MSRFVPVILVVALTLIGTGCASKKAAVANDQINQWLAGGRRRSCRWIIACNRQMSC